MDDLTGFQRDLLYVIAGLDRPSGASIRSEIGEYYMSDINHGRLYPNLDTLAEMALTEKGVIDKRTNSYSLTAAGNTAIRERREWEDQHFSEAAHASPDLQAS